jgi:hypothetical protein
LLYHIKLNTVALLLNYFAALVRVIERPTGDLLSFVEVANIGGIIEQASGHNRPQTMLKSSIQGCSTSSNRITNPQLQQRVKKKINTVVVLRR